MKIRVILYYLTFFLFIQVHTHASVFELTEFNPKLTSFKVYFSHQHHTLLIALEEKINSFCKSNHYYLYQFKKEQFLHIQAAHLSINPTFSKIFYGKLYALTGYSIQNNKRWKQQIQEMIQQYGVSSKTLDHSKFVSKDKTTFCWSQANIMNLKTEKTKEIYFLITNMCKQIWCSDAFWKTNDSIQFWATFTSTFSNLILYNTNTQQIDVLQKKTFNLVTAFPKENAPRKNRVTKNNLFKHKIKLFSSQQKKIELTWYQKNNGNISLQLKRNFSNFEDVKVIHEKIETLLNNKKYTLALKKIPFSLWLSNSNVETMYLKLKVLASLFQFEVLFDTLQYQFSNAQKKIYCKKLLNDLFFKPVQKKISFQKKWQVVCGD